MTVVGRWHTVLGGVFFFETGVEVKDDAVSEGNRFSERNRGSNSRGDHRFTGLRYGLESFLVIPLDRSIIPLKRIRLLESSVNEAFAFKSLSNSDRLQRFECRRQQINWINIDREK